MRWPTPTCTVENISFTYKILHIVILINNQFIYARYEKNLNFYIFGFKVVFLIVLFKYLIIKILKEKYYYSNIY